MAFNAEMQLDVNVREKKFFECRWWCTRMARAGRANFAESDVNDIVSANLRDLFALPGRGCIFAPVDSQHFVQQLIAEAMLGLMENLLAEPVELSDDISSRAVQCSSHLPWVVRALTKPQRQKWVSLLVRLLQGQRSYHYQKTVMEHLELLWRADDDPRRSYTEADQQLLTLSRRSSDHVTMPSFTDKEIEVETASSLRKEVGTLLAQLASLQEALFKSEVPSRQLELSKKNLAAVEEAATFLSDQPLDCKQGRHAKEPPNIQLHDRAANTCRLANIADLFDSLRRAEAGISFPGR
ncbi:unnamed protein product [Symbiodinium sp. CCMP2592]|nr:unnamed protein product [Symbiodinium sp. CCMP2592]